MNAKVPLITLARVCKLMVAVYSEPRESLSADVLDALDAIPADDLFILTDAIDTARADRAARAAEADHRRRLDA